MEPRGKAPILCIYFLRTWILSGGVRATVWLTDAFRGGSLSAQTFQNPLF